MLGAGGLCNTMVVVMHCCWDLMMVVRSLMMVCCTVFVIALVLLNGILTFSNVGWGDTRTKGLSFFTVRGMDGA